ncbi:MAG: TraV family lipoprotein [Candidatus Omnitrophica bacterium]|nr:TraV family lipoprotein [Candidatus Omnitrophota bacterium]
MDLRKTIPIAFVILINMWPNVSHAEKRKEPDDSKVKTFAETYRRSKEAKLPDISSNPAGLFQMAPQMGYVKPYLPVMVPPRVVKVWIPAHTVSGDKDVLVAGHWTFVMVEEPGWYIKNELSLKMTAEVIVPSLPRISR